MLQYKMSQIERRSNNRICIAQVCRMTSETLVMFGLLIFVCYGFTFTVLWYHYSYITHGTLFTMKYGRSYDNVLRKKEKN